MSALFSIVNGFSNLLDLKQQRSSVARAAVIAPTLAKFPISVVTNVSQNKQCRGQYFRNTFTCKMTYELL